MNKRFVKNTNFEILTPSGFQDFDGILITENKKTTSLILSDDSEFVATSNHRVLAGSKLLTVSDISIGDNLNDSVYVRDIVAGNSQTVYDPVNVANGNLYISGSLISHNCEFIGASNTLIAGSKLKSIPISQPVFSNSITAVYEKAQPGRRYCMTVDTSRGTGGDYSAFVVFDVSELPYRVVFRYRNNSVSSMIYPSMIYKIALEYNSCPVLVESNDVGESVAAALYFDLEYEETIFSKAGEICGWSGGNTSQPGLRTTTKTKRIGCDILKQLVEADKLVVNDYDILNELSNFVVKGKSYEADVGHDDLVMCLVMFAYLTTTVKFEEISDQSVRERIISERKLLEEAEMMPVGYYSAGTEQQTEVFDF